MEALQAHLHWIDWSLILLYFVISLVIGIVVTRRAGSSASEFFLSGRSMPWWLLGVSMVATTFSTDTPNLVTDITRQNGVAGNWVWWAFLLTGMLTVFIYARLWRRSGVMTDNEFYELRYSGKSAAFLRGFRALYLGVFFNICIMATVTLAAIKIGRVILGFSPLQTVLVAMSITVVYSMLGGFLGVLITDFFQFFIAIAGSIAAAYFALKIPEVGGLSNLLVHPNVAGKLSLLPDFTSPDKTLLISVFIIPIAVQWWSVWYPGAEPGGGGYLAQRMLAAKDERNAMGATLFFNIAHYALRPWPWIIVALCSLVVFPDLASIRTAFPNTEEGIMGHDLAYPAMLVKALPVGVLGLVLASLAAAYMSTIATHLNWGSSYIVNDFYKRFIKPTATDKEQVRIGRGSTALLMLGACGFAFLLQNAKSAFDLLLQIGAGTGLMFILRWFWWRINPWSEITGMVASFLVALFFFLQNRFFGGSDLATWQQLVVGVGVTTVAWLTVTLLTSPSEETKLRSFYRLTRPSGPGWKAVLDRAQEAGDPIQDDPTNQTNIPMGILCMVFGCAAVWGALFATGYWIYGQVAYASILTVSTVIFSSLLYKTWEKV